MQAFMVVLTIILIYEPKGEASNLLHYYCALVHVSKYTRFVFFKRLDFYLNEFIGAFFLW